MNEQEKPMEQVEMDEAVAAEIERRVREEVQRARAEWEAEQAQADAERERVLDGCGDAAHAADRLAGSAAGKLRSALDGADFGGMAAALDGIGGIGAARGGILADVGGQTALEERVRAAVEEALGGVTLTVPLNVDGMKLGEASIRGINAVTRSTGKVLLKL